MLFTLRVCLPKVRQDCKLAGFGHTEPSALLCTVQVACREDILAVRGPPVRARGGSKNEFIAVVKDDKCVGGMGCGYEYDTHLAAEE